MEIRISVTAKRGLMVTGTPGLEHQLVVSGHMAVNPVETVDRNAYCQRVPSRERRVPGMVTVLLPGEIEPIVKIDAVGQRREQQ